MEDIATHAKAVDPDAKRRFGGKACGLAELQRLGCQVPPWFAVSTEVFAELLDEVSLEADDPQELQRRVRQLELPERVAAELGRARRVHLGEVPLAVRSSGVSEDSDELSFAGVHESILFVETDAELCEAVKHVWASAFDPRAVEYRERNGRPASEARLGVVVQTMVQAEASGVAFTANPATGDVEEVVVEALWGAGEGLVTGGLSADRWVVDKQTGETEREVAEKPTQYAVDRSLREVVEQRVPNQEQQRPCLDDATVEAIVERARQIEGHFRRPQDIEFVVDADGELYFVQSRPVTTVDQSGPAAGERRVWDNSNIVESYAGTTTPMTFSFIQHVYAKVYRRFGDLIGVSQERAREFAPELDHKLGFIRGRVYYNLQNWYDTIELLPGWRLNAETLEAMLGVDETSDRPERPDASGWAWLQETGDMVRVLAQTGWRFARIEKLVEAFEADFEQKYRRWLHTDFAQMTPRELMDAYETMERDFLDDWGVPILNHYFVMIFHGLFEKLCAAWLDDEGRLANDLLCGEGGIATKEASSELLRLAELAREDEELSTRILEGDLDGVHDFVLDRPESDAFRAGVEAYLDAYGYRSMEELKLEEPTLRERPRRLYQLMRNYLRTDDTAARDPHARKRRERGIRQKAEERAFGQLGGWRRVAFRKVLSAARFGVRSRENMRFARTRVFGLVREVLVETGRRFAERDILERPDDIFYLGIDEVWDYVRGSALTTRLDALVDLRRDEFESYDADAPQSPPDDRFLTYGIVYHDNTFQARPTVESEEVDADWHGTGCSSGVVEREVKVVASPEDDIDLSGQILVARQTDPGWVSLFPAASALVVERGSPLSHSAIVAREMGLPAVVGVPGATTQLESGDRIRVDGETGVIERLEE